MRDGEGRKGGGRREKRGRGREKGERGRKKGENEGGRREKRGREKGERDPLYPPPGSGVFKTFACNVPFRATIMYRYRKKELFEAFSLKLLSDKN